jgi:hypothetical protein
MNFDNINKQWHEKNKMPSRPTMDQRIEWHKAHILNCGCRGVPPEVKAEIERRNNEEGA